MADKIAKLCENFTKLGMMRECEKRCLSSDGDKKTMAQRIIDHDTMTAANDGANVEAHSGSHERGFEAIKNDDNNCGTNANVDDDVTHTYGDAYDERESISDDEPEHFHTAIIRNSTQDFAPNALIQERVYAFRDVEESIESFSAENDQDVRVWLNQFEDIARMARWNDEQKVIMCRRKVTGTAKRFLFSRTGLNTYSRLKQALIAEFALFVRASDVHWQLERKS